MNKRLALACLAFLLIHGHAQSFFAVSGCDNANGDVIRKAINAGADEVSATLSKDELA